MDGPSSVPPYAIVPIPYGVMKQLTWPSSLGLAQPQGGTVLFCGPDIDIFGDTRRVLSTLRILPSPSGISTIVFSDRSRPCTPRENQASISENDFPCLANHNDDVLE